ncbi:hypothetical protein [Salinibaculum salinum]|uniref:hypothetical protein n=1 Tax=Salinibaculum salinum TaxID=3131996 RepID=UPI0030EB202A
MQTVARAIETACGFFDGRTRDHLAAYGLGDPSPQAWYDVADYVAVYDDLLDSTGQHTVRRIGKELASEMVWDRDPESFAATLSVLDSAYNRLHRGSVGGYKFEQTGEEAGQLVCATPYPATLEEGLLRGLAQRFTDTGFVTMDLVGCEREDGLRVVTFDVEWWDGTDIGTPETSEADARSATNAASAN